MIRNTKTIGLVCADSSDMYLSKGVYYLEKRLSEAGCLSMLCTTGYTRQRKQDILRLLVSKDVDAVILIGSHFVAQEDSDNDYIREAAARIPVFLLNTRLDHPNVYYAGCDDYQSSKDATLALIDSGADSLLYFYDTQSYSGNRKQSGFLDACEERGIKDNFHLLYVGDREDIEGVADRLDRLRESGMKFSAIMCSEDYLAVGAMRFAGRNGIPVPQDLQIIGYNDSLLTKCCVPELTSVNNRLEDICEHIVTTLTDILNGKPFPENRSFNGIVVKRGSTRS